MVGSRCSQARAPLPADVAEAPLPTATTSNTSETAGSDRWGDVGPRVRPQSPLRGSFADIARGSLSPGVSQGQQETISVATVEPSTETEADEGASGHQLADGLPAGRHSQGKSDAEPSARDMGQGPQRGVEAATAAGGGESAPVAAAAAAAMEAALGGADGCQAMECLPEQAASPQSAEQPEGKLQREGSNVDSDLHVTVFEMSMDPIVVVDMTRTVVECNQAFVDIVKYTNRSEIIGVKKCPDDFSPVMQPCGLSTAQLIALSASQGVMGVPISFEWMHAAKDGTLIPTFVRFKGIQVKGVNLFVAVWHDLTESKKQEDELRKAKEDAEAANRAKNQFLANMSHELRTPLNGVMGVVDLLLASPPLTPEQRSYLHIIRSSSGSLLSLLSDILDMCMLEDHSMAMASAAFTVREVVAGAEQLMQALAVDKGLQLTAEVSEDVPRTVKGDGQRLRQILLNLISNGVKFTEKGHVALEVSVASPAEVHEMQLTRTKPGPHRQKATTAEGVVSAQGGGGPGGTLESVPEEQPATSSFSSAAAAAAGAHADVEMSGESAAVGRDRQEEGRNGREGQEGGLNGREVQAGPSMTGLEATTEELDEAAAGGVLRDPGAFGSLGMSMGNDMSMGNGMGMGNGMSMGPRSLSLSTVQDEDHSSTSSDRHCATCTCSSSSSGPTAPQLPQGVYSDTKLLHWSTHRTRTRKRRLRLGASNRGSHRGAGDALHQGQSARGGAPPSLAHPPGEGEWGGPPVPLTLPPHPGGGEGGSLGDGSSLSRRRLRGRRAGGVLCSSGSGNGNGECDCSSPEIMAPRARPRKEGREQAPGTGDGLNALSSSEHLEASGMDTGALLADRPPRSSLSRMAPPNTSPSPNPSQAPGKASAASHREDPSGAKPEADCLTDTSMGVGRMELSEAKTEAGVLEDIATGAAEETELESPLPPCEQLCEGPGGGKEASEKGSTVYLQFTVRDSGVGIPRGALKRLFRPFMQSDDSDARRATGAGLGLAITHSLVTLMGGRLAVESTPGVGSCFTVVVPLRTIEAREAPAEGDDRSPVAGQVAGQSADQEKPEKAAEGNDRSPVPGQVVGQPEDQEMAEEAAEGRDPAEGNDTGKGNDPCEGKDPLEAERGGNEGSPDSTMRRARQSSDNRVGEETASPPPVQIIDSGLDSLSIPSASCHPERGAGPGEMGPGLQTPSHQPLLCAPSLMEPDGPAGHKEGKEGVAPLKRGFAKEGKEGVAPPSGGFVPSGKACGFGLGGHPAERGHHPGVVEGMEVQDMVGAIGGLGLVERKTEAGPCRDSMEVDSEGTCQVPSGAACHVLSGNQSGQLERSDSHQQPLEEAHRNLNSTDSVLLLKRETKATAIRSGAADRSAAGEAEASQGEGGGGVNHGSLAPAPEDRGGVPVNTLTPAGAAPPASAQAGAAAPASWTAPGRTSSAAELDSAATGSVSGGTWPDPGEAARGAQEFRSNTVTPPTAAMASPESWVTRAHGVSGAHGPNEEPIRTLGGHANSPGTGVEPAQQRHLFTQAGGEGHPPGSEGSGSGRWRVALRQSSSGSSSTEPVPFRHWLCHSVLKMGQNGSRGGGGQAPVMGRAPSPVGRECVESDELAVAFEGLRCLVVEDNLVNQMVLQRMLRMVHVNCEMAANGAEALVKCQGKQYDVIFMDCQMPVMDGYEATVQLRQHCQKMQSDDSGAPGQTRGSSLEVASNNRVKGAKEPYSQAKGSLLSGEACSNQRCFFWGRCACCPAIIAVTANAVAGSEDKCRGVGMNGFVAKPIQLADVALVLLNCMGKEVEYL